MIDQAPQTKPDGEAPASTDGLGANRQGNVLLCSAWGETDRPSVCAACDRDEVRRFIVGEWLGAEDSKNADGSQELPMILNKLHAHDWNDGTLEWELEIGGVRIEDVFMVSTAGLAGRWEHCSPELLQAGIDCGNTPRRPCECEHGGSHDHFISGDRLEIETFDASGKRVQWGIGPTEKELLSEHNAGTCHAFCAYCITEAERLMTHNVAVQTHSNDTSK